MELHDEAAGTATTITKLPRASMPVLPEEIICEILSHCRIHLWTYKELAMLCVVQKGAWLKHARRALYRDIRIYCPNIVNRLIPCLSLHPPNASLAQNMEIWSWESEDVPNAAHFSVLPSIRRLVLKEMYPDCGPTTDWSLCRPIIGPSLTSLVLHFIPIEYSVPMLKIAAPVLRSLDIHGLGYNDDLRIWDEGEEWAFPRLTDLALFLDDMNIGIVHSTLVRHSAQLKHLAIWCDFDWPTLHKDAHWQNCHFVSLQSLQLDCSFSRNLDMIQRTLQLFRGRALTSIIIKHFDHEDWDPDAASSSADNERTSPYFSLLSALPNDIEDLQIIDAEIPAFLPSLSHLLAECPDWLPRLKRLPKVNVYASNPYRDYGKKPDVEVLKRVALEGARSRGLYFTPADERLFFHCRYATLSP